MPGSETAQWGVQTPSGGFGDPTTVQPIPKSLLSLMDLRMLDVGPSPSILRQISVVCFEQL